MKFKDKTVLVTGGSRGIGKATSFAFANEGATLIINYHTNRDSAEALLQKLPYGPHHLVQADIAVPAEAERLIQEAVSLTGRLDVLINNAAIHETHAINEVDYENWQRIWHETLATNLFGPANTMFHAAKVMMAQGYGRIVNVSSRGAFRGEPDQPAYGASKAGLNALSQSLAQKLAPWGIYVAVVAPCFTETDMTKDILNGPRGPEIRKQSPIGRVAHADEVAKAVVFLAEPGTEYMTGAILDVNGASYLRS